MAKMQPIEDGLVCLVLNGKLHTVNAKNYIEVEGNDVELAISHGFKLVEDQEEEKIEEVKEEKVKVSKGKKNV